MTNHIGRSIKNNPVEWALVIIFFTSLTYMVTVALNHTTPVCVVEATPIQ